MLRARTHAVPLATELHVLDLDLDGTRFVTAGNPHGVSGAETVFEYHTDGRRITFEWGWLTGDRVGGTSHYVEAT